MSQMVVYLRLSRKVVNELEKRAPPEEWGPILEELLKRAKNLQPKRAPRGEKVELELYLPKTLPRKLSARARVWGVSWDDVIWTLLTSKTDEVKRASTKKALLKLKKKKTTKVTSPAPKKKRAITPEEEDFEVVISPMKRIKMKEDVESTLEQLEALKNNLSKVESDLRFFIGDEKKAKKKVEEYRKEIRELERKLKNALEKIGEERLKESELDRIGMAIAEAEALRGRIFDELEAQSALMPDDYYEPDLGVVVTPEELEALSDEELLDRYFEAQKRSRSSKSREEKKEQKEIKIPASESFKKFLNLAKEFGTNIIYIEGSRAVFLDPYKYVSAMVILPVRGDFNIELPPVKSFEGLESIIVKGNTATWRFEDGREYVTDVGENEFALAERFEEVRRDVEKNALATLRLRGPKFPNKIDRTPKSFKILKNFKMADRGDIILLDARNGKIVVGNSVEIEKNLKHGRRDKEMIWKGTASFSKDEMKDINFRGTPALVALQSKPFSIITRNLPEGGRVNIYLDKYMVEYHLSEGKDSPIWVLQSTFPEEGMEKIWEYYWKYERLPMLYSELKRLD